MTAFRVVAVSRECRAARRGAAGGAGEQLSLVINGAFVSSQILEAVEATGLLRRTAKVLVEAGRG